MATPPRQLGQLFRNWVFWSSRQRTSINRIIIVIASIIPVETFFSLCRTFYYGVLTSSSPFQFPNLCTS